MEKKEIVVDRRLFFSILIALAMIVLIGLSLYFRSLYGSNGVATEQISTSDPLSLESAKNVAENSATAYFTVNYQDSDSWLNSFQMLADTEGMRLTRNHYFAVIWPVLLSNEIVSQVAVKDSQLLANGEDRLTRKQWQIWSVHVQLSDKWPAFDEILLLKPYIPWPHSTEVDVFMYLFEVSGEWKFAMFLEGADALVISSRVNGN